MARVNPLSIDLEEWDHSEATQPIFDHPDRCQTKASLCVTRGLCRGHDFGGD